ncbi:MAG: ABC transporter permease [Actinobacteria bacterium]|nr:ABC transporter permease [Actinomycetota bacterium]
MNSNLLIIIATSAVFYGTPLFYAALGELFAERSGVLNLGVEGMMLVGGVTGAWASQHVPGTSWFVVLASIVIGACAAGLLALLHAFLVITLRTNQTVAGLSITIFGGGLGLSSYFANVWNVSEKPVSHPIRILDVGGLADTPIIGPIVFNQTILTYASWVLCVLATIYLFRTRIGLHLRAVGESPQTADAMGINVTKYRYFHTVFGGLLAGVGGVYYSLTIVPTWVDGMTRGAGWIAIALVIFGFWRPGLTLAGAYVFGALQSLSLTLKARNVHINGDLLDALPFLMTIFILVVLSSAWAKKRLGAPAALGQPYEREER